MTGHLGRLPLPRDDRDFLMRALLPPAALAREARSRRFWTRPLMLDQGATGTCVGNAWTGWLADGPIYHPDIAALYDPITGEAYARQLYVEGTGDTSLQQGAYTRQILNVLVGRGTVGAYHKAQSVDEVLTCLLSLGPICFGSNWYSSMDTPRDEYENAYLRVDESSDWRGGHEYLLDAIDLAPLAGPPYVRLHNSWGPTWAHGGTARVTIPDLHILFEGDAFVCTENPT